MTPISQRAANIKGYELGTCQNETFGSSGCKLVSLSSMYDLDPVAINKQFIKDGVYQNGCMISDELAAKSLGVEFGGRTTTMPTFMCIAETDNYKSSGVPQHFFVWIGQGNMIMDPLTGTIKTNNYHIISWRLFKTKGTTMSGFSDTQIKGTVRETLRIARQDMLGGVDPVGLDADVNDVFKRIQNGELDPIGKMLRVYENATDFKWKKECPPQDDLGCPPKDCVEEIGKATATAQKEIDKRDKEISACKTNLSIASGGKTLSRYDHLLIALGIK